MTNTIDYTEFWSNDPAVLGKFLQDVFGWYVDPPHTEYMHFRYQEAEKPTAGGIHNGGGKLPEHGTRTQVYINVANLDETIEKVNTHGGKIIYGPYDIGDGTLIINFTAPEGTPIGAWSHPEK
ncbi:MAG: VOC family protein [bacterium]|nr:VOC family protein [bacterium]